MKHLLVLTTILVLAYACGRQYDTEYTQAPPQDEEFAPLASEVAEHCGRCHNGSVHPLTINSGETLRKGKARIEAGTMPPAPAKLPADTKARFLAYLD